MQKIWGLGKILLIICCTMRLGQAQDTQFSQFYANPLYLNPALTGSHSGTFRLTSAYRRQWASALESPLTSFSAGGDLKITLPSKTGSALAGYNRAALGVQFFSDRAQAFEYNTNQISFFGAFHKVLSNKTNTYLSAGFSLGIGQRGINYEDINFQDQFDGLSGYSGNTSELLPANALGYSDLSFGVQLSHQPKPDRGIHLGAALHHLNQPNISFYSNDRVLGEDYEIFRLPSRLTLHGGVSFGPHPYLSIQPRATYLRQGKAQSAIVGTNIKYAVEDSENVSLHLGGWIRASDNISTWQPTDIIISIGLGRGGTLFGLSYDYNLRNFSGGRIGQGTFELTISYTGDHENEDRLCPEF